MSFGPYAAYIVACYALVAIVVAMLIGWTALDFRRQRTILRDLERAGVTRRSAQTRRDTL